MNGRSALIAIAILLACVPSADAQASRFGTARARIKHLMDSLAIPAVGVAVAKDGEILWEEGFGWADRERMIPATAHTMFSLASISKPMTATGVMRLVEQGKLSLDKPVNDYLGRGTLSGLAGDAAGATVRRVLSHTAGLPLHYQFFYENGGAVAPSMDETIRRYAILVSPPGSTYEYSNLGYGILDHAIARASGLSYADYMRTQVFQPLGMTRTSVHLEPAHREFAARRYDARLQPIPFYGFDHDGGSAIWSSAHDLVRFGMYHLRAKMKDGPRLLADSSLALMQRVATPGDTSRGYGLGWAIGSNLGHRTISHSGGMPGVSTLLVLYPDDKTVVTVLVNRSTPGVSLVAAELSAALLPRFADSLRARRARPATPPPAAPAYVQPKELLGEWRGVIRTWTDTVGFSLLFQADGDVHARIGTQLSSLVNGARWSEGRFTGRFLATIPTDDARHRGHSVLLNLALRDGRLTGAASALSGNDPVYFALTSYVDLGRHTQPSASRQ